MREERNLENLKVGDVPLYCRRNGKYVLHRVVEANNRVYTMLGDAQNIVLCKNEADKIKVYSQPLEGYVDEKSMVDYIAEITDGGKSSIKKRVKKYNLKSFKEEQ